MATELMQSLTIPHAPQPERLIVRCGGHHRAVWTEGHLSDSSAMALELVQTVAALHAPYGECPIARGCCQQPAIRAEGHAAHGVCVGAQDDQQPPQRHIPDANRAIAMARGHE